MGILTQIIEILVGGLVGIGEGIGAGLSSMATSIFLVEGAEGAAATLSVFGSLIVVFAAISLGLALTRWTLNFLTSLGARNR